MLLLWIARVEHIPQTIAQYNAHIEEQEQKVAQMQPIVSKEWKKEDELKGLKSELAALDRKIQLDLAPPAPDSAEQKEMNTQYEKNKDEYKDNSQRTAYRPSL